MPMALLHSRSESDNSCGNYDFRKKNSLFLDKKQQLDIVPVVLCLETLVSG